MTTSTQLQSRRGTSTQVAAMTPAVGEIIVDTTNKRVKLGDGSTAGGITIPNAADIQNQTFFYPTVGGTGNAITLTNVPPIAALQAGQCFEWKCTNAGTSSATIQVDGLTAKAEEKVSSGALAAMASGDHIVGVIYRSRYDGTQFQTQPWETNPNSYPAAITGTLSGASTVFTVDMTTYSAIDINLDNVLGSSGTSTLKVDVSTDGGSTYKTASRKGTVISSGATPNTINEINDMNSSSICSFMGTLSQATTSSGAKVQYVSNDRLGNNQVGATTYNSAAAINRIKISTASGTLSGNVTLQPKSKR